MQSRIMWGKWTIHRFKRVVKKGSEPEVVRRMRSIRKFVNSPITSNVYCTEQIFLIHYLTCFGAPKILEIFLIQFCDTIEQTTKSGKTALHFAVLFNKNENVLTLLNRGTNLNAVEKVNGMTPLHLAVQNNNIEVVKMLLGRMADTNIRNRNGLTAVDLAQTINCKQAFRMFESKEHTHETHIQGLMSALRQNVASEEESSSPTPISTADSNTNTNTCSLVRSLLDTVGTCKIRDGCNVPVVHIHVHNDHPQFEGSTPSSYVYNDDCKGSRFPIQAKRRIQENFQELIGGIRYKDIYPSLFQKNLLREDDMERFGKEHLTTREQMSRFFYEILFKCSADGFNRFVQVLNENHYEEYADLIRCQKTGPVVYSTHNASVTGEDCYSMDHTNTALVTSEDYYSMDHPITASETSEDYNDTEHLYEELPEYSNTVKGCD